MDIQYLDEEMLDEGQEEWLSEGILTDDDYNPAIDQDQNDSNLTHISQDETMNSMDSSAEKLSAADDQNTSQDALTSKSKSAASNIEETLNNLENAQNEHLDDLPDELDTFLIRKADGKVLAQQENKEKIEAGQESDVDHSVKQSDDDGNDTDDLLRMLGDGDDKDKGKLNIPKEKVKLEDMSSDEDDDYIFAGAQVKRVKVAKTALMRKYPATKAVPEDDDITDVSTDEEVPVQKAYRAQHNRKHVVKQSLVKPAPKPVQSAIPPVRQSAGQPVRQSAGQTGRQSIGPSGRQSTGQAVRQSAGQAVRQSPRQAAGQSAVQNKKVVINIKQNPGQEKSPLPTPPKQYTTKAVQPEKIKQPQRPQLRSVASKLPAKSQEPENIIVKQKVKLEEKQADTSRATSSGKDETQRIMCPEKMDEDIPTDGESDSEDESIYDELPSSDSENLDEWFTLDIRAERAGDYIPLLGDKAHALLTAERQRVEERVRTLQQSLSSLAETGRVQSAKLRHATTALAQLDAAISAA